MDKPNAPQETHSEKAKLRAIESGTKNARGTLAHQGLGHQGLGHQGLGHNSAGQLRTPLLDRIASPRDLRNLSAEQLTQVADELRAETLDAVSTTGGHLGASLGVVELTVALHAVFDTPSDRLIWDVGHQTYPHKILTERRDRIRTLRQPGGLSGFTRRSESEYDPFGAAHSSTSISAGLGMATAHDLLAEQPIRRTGRAPCHRGDRRRRDFRRHGLRGDEQCRIIRARG